MSNISIEQMKKIIADKKTKSSQQGTITTTQNKFSGGSNKGFKNTKRSGALNK